MGDFEDVSMLISISARYLYILDLGSLIVIRKKSVPTIDCNSGINPHKRLYYDMTFLVIEY